MGLLQIGWFSVGTFVATNFMLAGVGSDAKPGSMTYAIVAIVWGYIMGFVGIKGIQYVSKVSLILNFIPAVMLIVVLFKTFGGISLYTPDPAKSDAWGGMSLIIAAVVGFFATAGAAGADFGMNSRHEGDVKKGGMVGIAVAAIFAGGLPLLAVAGAHGLDPSLTSYSFDAVIAKMGGFLSPAMFFLFTLASIPASCVCALIAGNSFATMLPGVPRMGSTMVGVTIAIALAVTGVAADLIGFFSIVGASFGPICGAMVADYLLAGKKWAGPRQGINWAGYGAWAIGFVVGILPFLPLPENVKAYSQPAVVYSAIVGFLVYLILAKAGLEPSVVPVENAKPLGARSARA
jgi:cytosine permease